MLRAQARLRYQRAASSFRVDKHTKSSTANTTLDTPSPLPPTRSSRRAPSAFAQKASRIPQFISSSHIHHERSHLPQRYETPTRARALTAPSWTGHPGDYSNVTVVTNTARV